MSYTEHDTLPDFVLAEQDETGATTNHGGTAVWSGLTTPPAVGETVYIDANQRGFGTVRGYFLQTGWLGVIIDLLDPPNSYIDRHGGNVPCHAFGAEISAPPAAGPGDIFTAEQLGQLRSFYAPLPRIDPCKPTYARLVGILDTMNGPQLRQIADADINFMSVLARNRCTRRGC